MGVPGDAGKGSLFRGGALMEQAGAARRALGSPRGERERLQALASFRVGPTSEPEFDGIASLTARVTGMPTAFVSFVDGRREWVKAVHGAPLPDVPRSTSFGGTVIETGGALVVEDTARDERFAAHPWVAGGDGGCFYAGVPLTAPGGLPVGTLAVIDRSPRPATDALLDALSDAAAVLMPHLERRREEALAQNLTAVVGFDGRFQRVSIAFESVLGWTAEEMVSRHVLEFVHPDDADRTRTRIERIAGGFRGVGGFENRYRAKDGSYRWLLWNSQVVPHERRFYSAGKDITDRKRNELALRESEARYRLLTENATDMITGHDLEGRVTYASAATEALTGYRASELVGVDAYDLVYPDDEASIRAAHVRLLDRLQPVRYTWRLKRKDGSLVWVESVTRVVRDERLRPSGLQSATRDISVTKKALDELHAAREHFRSAFDEAPVGMAIIGLGLRIERVNAALCEVVGYSAEEMVGRNPRDFTHVDDHGIGQVPMAELAAGKRRTYALEERLLHRDGREIWVRITASLMNTGTGEPELLTHVEDISDRRKAAAELLRAREAAERANEAKGDFLSRMSHELRTPLNAVLGFAQLLEADALTGPQRESVTRILRGGYHLLSLVNDVLDMSAIEAGRLPVSTDAVPAAAVVRDTVELLRPLADERSVRVHCDLPPDGVVVLANEQRLKQVLLNLVSNAVKYSPAEADVTAAVEVDDAGWARFHVSDSGPGIPQESIERAFTPFERLGARRDVEGTGLGLPLSRNLVMAMGGTLTVDSGSAGSTFTVELPLAAEDAARAVQADADDAGVDRATGQTARVLYIEDNPSNVALLERFAERRGDIDLHAARRGDAGLDLARRLVPDVVVLDLHLPDTIGYEVLAELRADAATAAVPVIVVTADVTQEHEERLMNAGANAFLTKPLDLSRFEAELERALALSRPRAASRSPGRAAGGSDSRSP